ncbi:MAG: hypothetical protein CMM93_05790 [Rickettsiales bacterium]|nr:hypothetical protein [Rickettsiales bacterium]|tara:strand:- start:166 stop:591 length:426 start_codon:yes stop_codon:yes gene_type:complete
MIDWLFNTQEFMPHGYCFLWFPHILWLHIIGDSIIAAAYFSIPAVLLYLTWRRHVPFRWLFIMFAIFITLCGVTHVLGMITLWYPIYYFEGIVKVITAVVSIITAFLLFPVFGKLTLLMEQIKERDEETEMQTIPPEQPKP